MNSAFICEAHACFMEMQRLQIEMNPISFPVGGLPSIVSKYVGLLRKTENYEGGELYQQLLELTICWQSHVPADSLIEWVQRWSPVKNELRLDSIDMSNDKHWNLAYEYCAKGWLQPLFLLIHPYLTRKLTSVDDVESEYAVFDELMNMIADQKEGDLECWKDWREGIKLLVESNPFQQDAKLKTLLQMLVGDDVTIDKIGKSLGMPWYQVLITKLKFCDNFNPDKGERKETLDTVMHMFNRDEFEQILDAKLFDTWFLAHYADVMYHCDMVSKETRNILLEKYADVISGQHWRIALDYMQIKEHKRDLIDSLQLDSYFSLMKAKEYCLKNQIDPSELVARFAKEHNLPSLLIAEKNEDQVKALLKEYVVGTKTDFDEFEYLRRIKMFEEDTATYSVQDLFEAPKSIWIVILRKVSTKLTTRKLNCDQDTMSFLMDCVEELNSHLSDEYFGGLSKEKVNQELDHIRRAFLESYSRSIIY